MRNNLMKRIELIIFVAIISIICFVPVALPRQCNCDAKTTYKTETVKAAWKTVEARITEYCPRCNDPDGYQSSSGKRLEEGDAACRWLPVGTKIKVFGQVYTIVDTCGTDAIDLFRDTSECNCDLNTWTNVKIKEK